MATPYAAEAHTSFERALILTIVVFAGAVYASTQTIILVSLPQMQGDLSASIDQISWVVTANIVASAIGIPPTAWLSARFGRKRLFLFCIGLFIASCLLLSISTTLEEVVLRYRQAARAAGAELDDCIITKQDEAGRLAPVLDIIMRHGMRVLFGSNGQQVPDEGRYDCSRNDADGWHLGSDELSDPSSVDSNAIKAGYKVRVGAAPLVAT